MASRGIDDIFRSFVDDDRFKDAGLARGRGIVDDALVWEIRITDFDFDPDALAELRDIADREDLIFITDNGNVTLRERPGREL